MNSGFMHGSSQFLIHILCFQYHWWHAMATTVILLFTGCMGMCAYIMPARTATMDGSPCISGQSEHMCVCKK